MNPFTLETKEQSKQWTSSTPKKAKIGVGRKDDGHSFLGCTRYNSYRLFIIHIKTINSVYYVLLNRSTTFKKKEKISPFDEKESALPSRQCTGSNMPDTDGQIQRIPLRITELMSGHPAYSPDLTPCDYFLFPNLKK